MNILTGGNSAYCDNKGVTEACHRVSDLVAKLKPVVVNPATLDYGNSIGASDACLREKCSADVTDHTANAV
jgi:hypothetical protein